MTRTLRKIHRLVWPLLALAVGFALVLAFMLREPAHSLTLDLTAGLVQ